MTCKQKIQSSEAILKKYGKSIAGKTILITGVAADSIAGELAVQLSAAGPALLILSARSQARVEPVDAKIKAQNPSVATRFLEMDLSNQSDVRRAAGSLSDVAKIDHVACVAGVMWPPYSKTVDGIESQFATNYLANFQLVNLLLPQIKAAGPGSSIIVVASSAVRNGKVNFDDVNFSDPSTYTPSTGYSQSNAARVMFVKKLAQKLNDEKIRTYSVDPGAVRSGLQRHFTQETRAWIDDIRASGEKLRDLDGNEYDLPVWTSTSEGAATIITGMVDPTIADSNGAFLHNNAVADEELHSHIVEEENWDRLWELSEKLIAQ
ncbi:short-chain oxidoreductase [Cordyceps javanica]|uniref:Short-chain oxidoreductase n=1 Tax=Cordyceps javanica TaxID=43265 RepID=A0A545V7B5_9HYPO|nr:short-chain oxidoreductase [Cordyceps javanica]TQW09240.1 short-chain oxidoreductase [Cordyceps javanica]